MREKQTINYSLTSLVRYFLQLGATGFGGPVALVGYMYQDLVEDKKWISEEEYKEGLALSQLAPGPLAAQLGIYIGFVHYGIIGATATGLAFVIPSFVMVVLLGMIYRYFGGLPWMQAVFYGVGAAVIGIIATSSYKLTVKSIGKFNIQSFKDNALLWMFFVITTFVTLYYEREDVMLLIGLGLVYMFYKAPPLWFRKPRLSSVLLLSGIGTEIATSDKLTEIALFFAKAGAFVFGSGLAIVPFLHSGVVTQHGWLTESEFVDAVAVAMITPGPVVITVGFIGYLTAGFSGAAVAALATFLPCYILTILLAPYFKKIAKNQSIKAFVDGITAAVVGALVGAVIVIALRTIIDIPSALLATASVIILLYSKKIKEPHIVLMAALAGLVLKFLPLAIN